VIFFLTKIFYKGLPGLIKSLEKNVAHIYVLCDGVWFDMSVNSDSIAHRYDSISSILYFARKDLINGHRDDEQND